MAIEIKELKVQVRITQATIDKKVLSAMVNDMIKPHMKALTEKIDRELYKSSFKSHLR